MKEEGQADGKMVGQLDPAWLLIGTMDQRDCGSQKTSVSHPYQGSSPYSHPPTGIPEQGAPIVGGVAGQVMAQASGFPTEPWSTPLSTADSSDLEHPVPPSQTSIENVPMVTRRGLIMSLKFTTISRRALRAPNMLAALKTEQLERRVLVPLS